MSSDARPMIEAVRLSKRYAKFELSDEGETGSARSVLGRVLRTRRGGTSVASTFAALDDVTFSVNAGETVGVVGRNGAGKSTLLKILGLVTRPSSGRLALGGRVGSLLELGIGFHPDLSGRENVFVAGSLHGMSRRALTTKLDEIVEFAELAEFIDTPLRHYSSGMRARLGYAVASHVDADILIVDEALSVGDIAFQSKCLSHARSMASNGRVVVFVSHSPSMLATLCKRGLFLERGRLVADGPMNDVLEQYVRFLDDARGVPGPDADSSAREGAGGVRAVAVTLHLASGEQPTVEVEVGQPIVVDILLTAIPPGLRCVLNLMSSSVRLVALLDSATSPADQHGFDGDGAGSAHRGRVRVEIPELLIPPGSYSLGLQVFVDGVLEDLMPRAATFRVLPGLVHGRRIGHGEGDTVLVHRWSTAGADA